MTDLPTPSYELVSDRPVAKVDELPVRTMSLSHTGRQWNVLARRAHEEVRDSTFTARANR
jgi:hypothetical protein